MIFLRKIFQIVTSLFTRQQAAPQLTNWLVTVDNEISPYQDKPWLIVTPMQLAEHEMQHYCDSCGNMVETMPAQTVEKMWLALFREKTMIKEAATRHILCRNRGTFDLISFYDGVARSTYTYLHVRGLKRNNKRHICMARAKRKYFCAAPAFSSAEPSKALTINGKEFYTTAGKRIPAK